MEASPSLEACDCELLSSPEDLILGPTEGFVTVNTSLVKAVLSVCVHTYFLLEMPSWGPNPLEEVRARPGDSSPEGQVLAFP